MKPKFICCLVVIFLILTVSCTPQTQPAVPEQTKSDIQSLIPEGWHLLERNEGGPDKAEGDLNKDGISDIAMVIEETGKSPEEASHRALLLAFGKGNDSYELSLLADKAILQSDEGGVWGDPFKGVSIGRGSVLISFYGGSNWRWYSTYRFQFRDKDWYLIGATLGSYFTGTQTEENADEEDYNLISGDYIKRTTDDKGVVQTTKGNRGKKELLKLRDFIVNSDEIQF